MNRAVRAEAAVLGAAVTNGSSASSNRVVKAQQTLLSATMVNFSKYASIRAHGLNAVQATNKTSRQPPIMLLHGYGSGLGFFFRNLDHFTSRSAYAVDWLGLGGSDRPRKGPKKSVFACGDAVTAAETATAFFIDSLHEFFKTNVPDAPVVLVGHSLGGYLAARFALKYPGLVSKLILASPAGVANVDDRASRRMATRGAAFGAVIDAMWASNVTPQSVVRMVGDVRGRQWISNAVASRFGPNTEWSEHQRAVADYLFEITRAPPSGEYALNSLLKPPAAAQGIVARVPLAGLLKDRSDVRVLTLFGDHDWLASPAALQASKQIGDLIILPGAGHHLYLDNYKLFNRAVLDA